MTQKIPLGSRPMYGARKKQYVGGSGRDQTGLTAAPASEMSRDSVTPSSRGQLGSQIRSVNCDPSRSYPYARTWWLWPSWLGIEADGADQPERHQPPLVEVLFDRRPLLVDHHPGPAVAIEPDHPQHLRPPRLAIRADRAHEAEEASRDETTVEAVDLALHEVVVQRPGVRVRTDRAGAPGGARRCRAS